jgi:hypothetical protein
MSLTARSLKDFIRNAVQPRWHGYLGRHDGDEAYTFDVPGRTGWTYVRIEQGDTLTLDIAILGGHAKDPFPRVGIDLDPFGRKKIVGADAGEYNDYDPGGPGSVPWHSHRLGTGLDDFVEGKRFEPGMVRNYSGLVVYISPFWYEYQGEWKFWPGGHLDLTSNLPGTSNKWAWCVVGVDPTDNTATATTGDSYAYPSVPLEPTMIDDIDTSDMIPCHAYKLRNGQSVVGEIETDIADTRPWLHYPVVDNGVFNARLTLTSGTSVTMSDVTAATTVYLTPHDGHVITLYDGNSWVERVLSEISIDITETQTGDTASGDATVTNLDDTALLCVGMEVTGTGIPASTTISSITDATTIELSNNATASGTGVTLTFKLPADSVADVFVYDDEGTPKLELVLWSGTGTSASRATSLTTQDGVQSKNGDTTRRLAGTIGTTATAGQTEDSELNRLCANYVNRVPKHLEVEALTNHTYSTASWRPWNNDSTLKATFVQATTNHISFHLHALVTAGADGDEMRAGIGLNSQSTVSVYRTGYYANAYRGMVAVSDTVSLSGQNYLAAMEYGNASTTPTFDLVNLSALVLV